MDRSKSQLKGKSIVKEDKHVELASKLEQTDEMKLKMLAAIDHPDPDDVMYPPELNAHLIEQLKIMTAENNELRKLLFEKNEEVKQQNQTIKDLNTRIRDIISGTGPTISSKSAGIISAKITDLCKKNRHLVAELESYKTKYAHVERKIMQLELINQENEKLDVCICKDDPVDAVSPEVFKELNTKLAIVNKKLMESKNRNLELKNEILLATKVLQKELGDKFTSIKELQNDVAGWKGRAQQIICLQGRVSELEERLNISKPKADDQKDRRGEQMSYIRDIENKKKKELQDLQKEIDSVKEENQRLSKKLDGSKCRIRNLECDALTLRQKMQTFVEKSDHDDELINEQRMTIKNLELYYQEILHENTVKINKMHNDILEYKKLTANTETKIEAMRKQSTEKATKIEELRAQLLRYEECSLQSVFFTPMRTATENEIKKLGEIVVQLNERLDSERQKWKELDTANRKLRERNKRLQRRVSTLEEDLRASDAKRGSKLSKLSLTKAEHPYDLVSSISGLNKKKSSIQATGDGPSESSSDSKQVEISESLDREDLKYKLELTEEKLKIMEDKLRMVEEEKLEDFNNFTSMIQTSKQLFNDALTVLQREKCICPA